VHASCSAGATAAARLLSKLIPADEAAMLKRGASNGGYHYLGCAKTFALMGEAFAEANLQLRAAQK
jgi:alpha-galactosidase